MWPMPEGIWLVNLNIRRQNRLDQIRPFRQKQNCCSAGTINDSEICASKIFPCLQTVRSEVAKPDYSVIFKIDPHV